MEINDKSYELSEKTPLELASNVHGLLAVKKDGSAGAVGLEEIANEAGKKVGDAVKISTLELPELGIANKYAKVLGGVNGKIYTYKGTQLFIEPNYEGLLFWAGNLESWSISDKAPMPMQEGTAEIVEGGNLLVNQDGVFKIKSEFDYNFDSIIDQTPVSTIIENNAGFNLWNYDTSIFAGWGDDYGILNNFNIINVYHKDLTATGKKTTKVNFRVCENDRSGAVLASGLLTVDFQDGEIGFIPFELGKTITNPNNAKIWFEYSGNGNMALPVSKRAHNPARKIRYKTTENFGSDFSVSSETASELPYYPYVVFSFVEQKISAKQVYSDDVLLKGNAQGNVTALETKAVSGKKVYNEVRPFKDIIEDSFNVESSEVVGGTTLLTYTSTFAAWGQLMGKKKNFDALKFPIRPYDADNLPTYVTMRIRKGGNTGEILAEKTVTGIFLVNTTYDSIFVLDSRFTNDADDNLFIQYHSDGYICCIGSSSGQTNPLYYETVKSNALLTKITTNQNVLRTEFLKGSVKGLFSAFGEQKIKEIAGTPISSAPNLLLATKVWLYPGSEYNIFNENILVPEFGKDGNFFLDYNCSVGAQKNRGYRLTIPPALNTNLSADLYENGNIILTKNQSLYSATLDFGNGVVRKVLFIGDSTVAGSKIAIHLKTIFDADVMKIEQIGTQGAAGVRQEGYPGWSVNDFSGAGRPMYAMHVSNVTVPPSIGAVYSQGINEYIVQEVNLNEGYFSVVINKGSAPAGSGILTKVSGSGDVNINYASVTQNSQNKFCDPATSKFSLSYYLNLTGQTMSDFDWIFFQLGINDMFSFKKVADAEAKTNVMISQIQEMIASIHAYNSNIRIGIVVTFPPADQNAFGKDYTTGQTSEMYMKIGLLSWQKKLLATFDNQTSINNKIYLVCAHHNMDRKFNYPTAEFKPNARYTGILTVTEQINGVHPNTDGNFQTADMVAGLIKYFG